MAKSYCCSWCYSRPHKDFIRGGVDEKDFLDEYPHVKMRGKTKKVRKKTRPGCPGNDMGPHIYVWTSEYNNKTAFADYFGWEKWEFKFCAGCGKRGGNARKTERYEKKNNTVFNRKYGDVTPTRGEPRPRQLRTSVRSYSFEYDHEGFQNYKEIVKKRRNLSSWDAYFSNHAWGLWI